MVRSNLTNNPSRGQPNWEDLPVELLRKILLSCPDTAAMRAVSRTWKRGLEATCAKLYCLGLSPPLPMNLPARFQSLTSLSFWHATIAPSATELKILLDLPLLRSLDLRLAMDELTKELSEVLHGLQLSCLSLELGSPEDDDLGCSNTWVGLLEGLPIQYFLLFGANTSAEGLESLREMPLATLCLGGRPPEGSEWADVLGIVRGNPLETLNLMGCVLDTPKSKKPLYLSEESLEALWGMPLTDLQLVFCDQFSDRGLAFLRGRPLRNLALVCSVGCRLTDGICEVLRGMPLVELDLFGCDSLTNAGFGVLQSISSLRSLLLEYTAFTDLGILRGLPLTRLNLGWTQITDLGWDAFRDMPLGHLGLIGCSNITGSGLIHLVEAPMETLEVDECPRLDQGKVAEFWEANTKFFEEVQEEDAEGSG